MIHTRLDCSLFCYLTYLAYQKIAGLIIPNFILTFVLETAEIPVKQNRSNMSRNDFFCFYILFKQFCKPISNSPLEGADVAGSPNLSEQKV